jgi:hypothetical protein
MPRQNSTGSHSLRILKVPVPGVGVGVGVGVTVGGGVTIGVGVGLTVGVTVGAAVGGSIRLGHKIRKYFIEFEKMLCHMVLQ